MSAQQSTGPSDTTAEPGSGRPPQAGHSPLSRRSAVLAALLVSVALAATSRATWLTALAPDITGHAQSIPVTGQQAQGALLPLALVAGAAAIATSLGGRWVRWVTGGVLASSGIGVVLAILAVVQDPASAARAEVARVTGIAGGAVTAHLAAWPWIALAPGVLLVLLGAAVLMLGGRWRTSRRYTAIGAVHAADPVEDPSAAWEALSRGADPTLTDDGRDDELDPGHGHER